MFIQMMEQFCFSTKCSNHNNFGGYVFIILICISDRNQCNKFIRVSSICPFTAQYSYFGRVNKAICAGCFERFAIEDRSIRRLCLGFSLSRYNSRNSIGCFCHFVFVTLFGTSNQRKHTNQHQD